VVADSVELRKRQLLVAANRSRQMQKPKIKTQKASKKTKNIYFWTK